MTPTPKEVAIQLVDKYKLITVKYVLNGEANEADVHDEAKECALLAVSEIIETIGNMEDSSIWINMEWRNNQAVWCKVKEELEKL